MQSSFVDVQDLWTQPEPGLQGIPRSVVQSMSETLNACIGQAVPVLQAKKTDQQLELLNPSLSSVDLLTSSNGTFKSNDPALVLLAQHVETKDAHAQTRLLYEVAKAHVQRHLQSLPDSEMKDLPAGDNNIAVASCARARRTILQTKLPKAHNRGAHFAETDFMQFGAVTARGMAHAHQHDHQHSAVLAAIHPLAARRKDAHPYLAAGIVQGQSPWHQDLSVAWRSSTCVHRQLFRWFVGDSW
eukprot:292219-Amphidinium_carterae.3